jgi:hypothetical protein
VAFEYRYTSELASLNLPWASLSETDNLSDGSAGDLSTGEGSSATRAAESAPDCSLVTTICYFRAVAYLGNAHTLSAVRLVGSLLASRTIGSACITPIGEDPTATPGSALAVVETSSNGTSWTEQVTTGLDAPNLLLSPPYSTTYDEELEIDSVVACWVRVTLWHSQNIVSGDASVTAQLSLTDFRITGTDSGTPCSGGGTDPDPDPGGGDEDCGCESWSRASLCTDDSGERAAATPGDTGTRRRC